MRSRMMTVLPAVGMLAAAAVLAGCGGDDVEGAAQEAATQAQSVIEGATDEVSSVTGEVGQAVDNGLTVQLNEQNGSGESGTATFTINDDGTTHVVLQITGGGTDPQPAHIHEGTCDDLNPQPAFPLQDVVNGSSETDVDISLDDLTLSSYAVNVHESAEEADVYVACGDITDVNG
jgi:CHRD domain-containing protein